MGHIVGDGACAVNIEDKGALEVHGMEKGQFVNRQCNRFEGAGCLTA